MSGHPAVCCHTSPTTGVLPARCEGAAGELPSGTDRSQAPITHCHPPPATAGQRGGPMVVPQTGQ